MTTNTQDALRMALEADAEFLRQVGGCTDGACIIDKPKGMHTNGGCKCNKNYIKMQQLAYAHRKLVVAVNAALSSAKDAVHSDDGYCEHYELAKASVPGCRECAKDAAPAVEPDMFIEIVVGDHGGAILQYSGPDFGGDRAIGKYACYSIKEWK